MEAGLGQTVNMGSAGIAFSVDRTLPSGGFIELSISWPVQLETGTFMRLVVFGRVLRCLEGVSACSVDKYEFRTQARPTAQNNAGSRTGADPVPRRWSSETSPRDPLKSSFLGPWVMSSYRA